MRRRAAILVLSLAGAGLADDLDRARALDQQGVRAYQQGRYRDAIALFEAALEGGPAIELWNIAKCHLKLDEPELADQTLARFLARSDLTEDDRRDAEKLRREIEARPSTLTAISSPLGAAVSVDGRAVGATPLAIELSPGEHRIAVGKRRETVVARFGRGILIDANQPKDKPIRRLTLELGAGASLPRYGDLGGTGLPFGFVSVGYALAITPVVAGVRARFGGYGDAWSGPSSAAPCALPSSFSAVELAGHLLGFLGVDFAERWRAGLELGAGASGTTVGSRVGGDLYEASCAASQSVQPSFHGSLDLSARVLPALRVVLRPLTIDLHPSYDGARPRGAWLRAGASLGVAFDL